MSDDNTTDKAQTDASVAAQNQTASTAKPDDVGNVNSSGSEVTNANTNNAAVGSGSEVGEPSTSTGAAASGEAQTQGAAASTASSAGDVGNATSSSALVDGAVTPGVNPAQGAADAGNADATLNSVGEQKAPSTETSSKEADPVKVHGHSLVEANAHLIEPSQHRNKLMELLHGVINDAERAEHWTVEELIEAVTYLRAKL